MNGVWIDRGYRLLRSVTYPDGNFHQIIIVLSYIWLVVKPYPSEKMMDFVSWMMTFPIYGKMFQTTNQIWEYIYINIYIYIIYVVKYENYYLIGMVYDHPPVKAGNRGSGYVIPIITMASLVEKSHWLVVQPAPFSRSESPGKSWKTSSSHFYR